MVAAVAAIVLCSCFCFLAACGTGAGTDPYAGRQTADLSGYESMANYGGDSRLVPTDAAEAVKLMKEGESFVLFTGYEDCGYCSQLLPYLNDAAAEAERWVGYIDTRSDPEWMTNNDIDDFDLFAEYFGNYLGEDENGQSHLYTPATFFVRDGEVIAFRDGVLEGIDDPAEALSGSQEATLRAELSEEFALLNDAHE